MRESESPTDFTALPKVFEITRAGRETAPRSSLQVEGYAGLVLTKRGYAVRCWVKDRTGMRAVLLGSDPRIIPENAGVAPKHQLEATGWPQSISPQEVVKSKYHALKVAPIPTRCYKHYRVTTWSLLFETLPSERTFLACFNNVTVEIVLSPPEVMARVKTPKKPKEKGHSSSQRNAVADGPDPTVERFNGLEARFSAMERRQDSMESKMQSSLDTVQDQLRQVLQAVAPRRGPHLHRNIPSCHETPDRWLMRPSG